MVGSSKRTAQNGLAKEGEEWKPLSGRSGDASEKPRLVVGEGQRLLGFMLALLLVPQVAGAMTYGRVTYSDMSMGSDGIIRGWGVTDANSSGCYCHTAKVTTTIRSPKGRTQTASDIYGSRGHEIRARGRILAVG